MGNWPVGGKARSELCEANYRGVTNIEGKGTDAQMAPAFATIAKQSAEV